MSVVCVRPMEAADVAEADRIMRVAFGTFVGMPQPSAFGGDSDFVGSRWRADPARAFVAEAEGRIVGSNLASSWGSFGFFGPLSVDPAWWGRGVAQRLMEPVLDTLADRGCSHLGLFTFASSAKHHALYGRYGFRPRYLTPILARTAAAGVATPACESFAAASRERREVLLAEARALTEQIEAGLDVGCEIVAAATLGLGDTLFVHDDRGLASFAVAHFGGGSEGGSEAWYLKFAAARAGDGAASRLEGLLEACESAAFTAGAPVVAAGVNHARRQAFEVLARRGYRGVMVGVAMQNPDAEGFNRADAFVLDDWR